MVKGTILHKAIYRFNAISIKLSIAFFTELEQKMSAVCMETQKTSNNQSNLEKERWSWRNHATQLQTILQSYNNQDSMVLAQKQECRSVVQDSKPRERNWCTFGHLIYEKGGKNIQFKKSLIHNWCRENWEGACKRMRRIFCISLNLKICLCLYLLCIYYLLTRIQVCTYMCIYMCMCTPEMLFIFFTLG